MFLSADKERGHFRPSWACITLNAQYNCPLSKLSHSAKRSILTGSHPRPMCSLRGALEGAAHPAPGHTLQGPRAGELPTGPGGVGGVTGRVGVPPPRRPLAGSLRQSPTGNRRRQHGPRGNPRRAPCQSVTQWGWPASCPPAPRPGPRGPGRRKQRSLCTDTDTGVLQGYSLRYRCHLKAGETE